MLDEGEVSGGFAKMEDDSPVEVEPAEMGLEYGSICCGDAVCEGGDKHGASVIDDETGDRDTWMIDYRGGWIEMDFGACGLDCGPDKAFPSGMAISEADFGQAFTNSSNDGCR